MSVTFVNEVEYLHLPIRGADGVQRTYKVMEATAAQSLQVKAIQATAVRADIAAAATKQINQHLTEALIAANGSTDPKLNAKQLAKQRKRRAQAAMSGAAEALAKLAGPEGDQRAAEISQQELHELLLGADVLAAMIADGISGRDLMRAVKAAFRYHLTGADQVAALEAFWGPSGAPVAVGDAA